MTGMDESKKREGLRKLAEWKARNQSATVKRWMGKKLVEVPRAECCADALSPQAFAAAMKRWLAL
jgi:hypothetical protein